MKALYVIAPLLLLGACIALPEPAGNLAVDDTFRGGGGTWSTGGRTLVAAKVVESGGMTAVCGAWSLADVPTDRDIDNDTVLAQGQIRSNGETLLHHLNFMRDVTPAQRLGGTQANCVLTDKPWREVYGAAGAEIVLFRFEKTPGALFLKGGGLQPRFRPAPLEGVI